MKMVQIPGLKKPCSQLVIGSMVFSPDDMKLTTELLDAYLEFGGNAIDSARVYGRGTSERAIGLWLERSGRRDDVVLITKGAHPNAESSKRVTPEAIAEDVKASLEELRTDFIDIYMLHRDDPDVPVGKIIDALNEHIAAGEIGVLGASNWSAQRIDEANAYAASAGLAGFDCNSPNLSLAKPNEPRWAGCVSVDEAYRAWHEERQLPLLSWSSQAGGFFTGRFSPDRTDDPDMVRVYYSDTNWERYRRAEQLAQQKGVEPNHIALAYVLNQPFPTCALIGPRTREELADSISASGLTLTQQELAWLDLRAE